MKMTPQIVMVLMFVVAATPQEVTETPKEGKDELLEGSESQNYGYGYGTKVDGPHGSSTVYVHGFGTDDGYDREEYHGGHHANAYGYGHIDPYLNAKHGYGYTKGYGYNQVQGYAGYPAHHGVVGHGVNHGVNHGVGHEVGHGVSAGHHGGHGVVSHGLGVTHGHLGVGHLPAGYGAGYGAPQPFVGNGFQYGHGYGYGYGR